MNGKQSAVIDNDHQLRLKEIELNALLEVTLAINNNLPEDALYKIYNFILRANLKIQKLLLCLREDVWQYKVSFGTKTDFYDIHQAISELHIREVTPVDKVALPDIFREFDLVIPVFHKDTILAYVFVEGLDNVNSPLSNTGITFLQTLTNIIVVAIENKKLTRRQMAQEAFNRELEIAQQVQSMLFPKNLPNTNTLKVKADYFPHHSVGGDYYDFVRINEHTFLMCVADVSGKGIPAALLMSNFQASLRILARQTLDLKQIIRELNFALYQVSGGERFITLFCALYDRQAKKLTYVNAGHNAPVLCRGQQEPELLEKGTTVLGIFKPLPFLEETVIEDLNEFLLFSYTDGLVEVTNDRDEEFGGDRISELVDRFRGDSPEAIHRRVIAAVEGHRAGMVYTDDVTLLTVRVRE
jgi:sigma-B regulation protein RsbU (phosphoserine phosphatase)